MGLTIDMCHDIENYKEDVVMGFDWKKSLYFIGAILVGAGSVFLFYKVLGWNLLVSVYAMMPLASAVVFCGFYTKNGMTFGQIIRRKIQKVNSTPIVSRSTECRASYEAVSLASVGIDARSEEEVQVENIRMLRKLIIGLVIGGAVFVVLIVLIAVFV